MVYVVVSAGNKRFKLLSNEKVHHLHPWLREISIVPVIPYLVSSFYYNVILSDEAYIRVFLWMWYAVNEQYAFLPKLTLHEMMIILPKMNQGRVSTNYLKLWWSELFSGRYHPGSKAGLGIWPDYRSPLAEVYREILERYYLRLSDYRNRIHTNLYPPDGEGWDIILHPIVKLTIVNFKLRKALLKRLGSTDLLGHLLTFLFHHDCKGIQLAVPLGSDPKRMLRSLRWKSIQKYLIQPPDRKILVESITNGFVNDDDEIYCSYTVKIGDMIVWGEYDVNITPSEIIFWTGSERIVPPDKEGEYDAPPRSLPSNNLGSAVHFHNTVGEDRYCWFDPRGYTAISHLVTLEEKFPYTGYGSLIAKKIGDDRVLVSLKVTIFTRPQERRWCIISEPDKDQFNDRFITYIDPREENKELQPGIMDTIMRYGIKAQYLLLSQTVWG